MYNKTVFAERKSAMLEIREREATRMYVRLLQMPDLNRQLTTAEVLISNDR